MSYTGGYETRYDTLPQGQLNALFSSAQWAGLSFAERLDACQEVANRYAAEHDVEPCLITHHPMEGSAYGEQFGSTIRLNTYLVRDGQFCTHFTDENGNDRMKEQIQENYNRIKAEVKQIVSDELQRIADDPELSHLLQQKG